MATKSKAPFVFCTLFDSYYLTKGLALYESLEKTHSDFRLYIFAFDEVSFEALTRLSLKKAVIVPLNEFETPDLLAVKPTRTIAEYCWTCTPWILRHVLERYDEKICTYLDADLYFLSSSQPVFEEMAVTHKSVLVSPHWYTPRYDQSLESGKYCVQFMPFTNNAEALAVLKRWSEQCLDWCFNRIEDGKFGDQKYLDGWTGEYSCVGEIENRGAGLAPWNVQQYELFESESGEVLIREKLPENRVFRVIFYHFHEFSFPHEDRADYGTYDLEECDRQHIYLPYVEHLRKINIRLARLNRALVSYRPRFLNYGSELLHRLKWCYRDINSYVRKVLWET